MNEPSLTVSQAYKEMRYSTTEQAEGKEPPSLGLGGPSLPAVKAGPIERRSFERLPREGAKAFAAFRLYLELGPDRSLAAVASKLGKSKVLMERWSRRYDWPGRVTEYGAYVAQVEREAIEALARERAVEWRKSTKTSASRNGSGARSCWRSRTS
jgi:hypothetical protein